MTLALTERGLGIDVRGNGVPELRWDFPGMVRIDARGVAVLEGDDLRGLVYDERALPFAGGGFLEPGEFEPKPWER